jgi:alpha-amylase/alpha-mannosidase (GH57 family)
MSASQTKLRVVLCWHMHQPDYRGPENSDFQLPWVYLHGIKDYIDMAAHLEDNPEARAVVNFAPVLLEQLDDYVEQLDAWLQRGTIIRDPLLSALAGPGLPVDQETRRRLVRDCQRANEKRLIDRFPMFRRLVNIANQLSEHEECSIYLGDQYLIDLLVWYHLAWMGEYPRSNDLRIHSLEKKRIGFNNEDRRRLVEVIRDLLSGIVERYRRLAQGGRIELSVTPYAHPIMPLLLDINSAREAMPEVQLPKPAGYPGGEERVRWQIRKGIEVFQHHFGFRPAGCWPSEGAVSQATLQILEEEGFQWAASGQRVLENSLRKEHKDAPLPRNWVHTPYRAGNGGIHCFFRDDGLSDFVGFTYAVWHADDAVADLINHLEIIANSTAGNPNAVASVILDGENAWEYYPRNGCFFLEALYQRLCEHPRLELTTFSESLRTQTKTASQLKNIVAGSWVYGTFSTWIGDRDKNRAWEMLIEAKKVYDHVMAEGKLTEARRAEAELQLAHCEGSDWFWWFGDYNPGDTVSDFERLFRHQLTHLYRILQVEPPEYLQHVFAFGDGAPAMGGVMRKN